MPISIECDYCNHDISKQMELYTSASKFFCSQDCRDTYIHEYEETRCLICFKNTNDICSIYWDGKRFCSIQCYQREQKLREILKGDPTALNIYSKKKSGTNDVDSTVEDLFGMSRSTKSTSLTNYTYGYNNETTCNYCNKYIKKTDPETIFKNKEYYCSDMCFDIKNMNRVKIVYEDEHNNELNDDVDYLFSDDNDYDQDNNTYSYNFWEKWKNYKPHSFSINNDVATKIKEPEIEDYSKYIKDSKREKK